MVNYRKSKFIESQIVFNVFFCALVVKARAHLSSTWAGFAGEALVCFRAETPKRRLLGELKLTEIIMPVATKISLKTFFTVKS